MAHWAQRHAQEHLQHIKKKKTFYGQPEKHWQFQVGDRVLVHSLLFFKAATQEWVGPFPILLECGPLIYEVRCGPRHQDTKTLHVNHLKHWYDLGLAVHMVAWSDRQPTPLSSSHLP